MFQSFVASASPEQGPPRLSALRAAIAKAGLTGFLVPRADAHQGEYVAPRDDRLAWLTGFTGSAGFAAILPDIAGVFIDGRYRVQVRSQVSTEHFTPVNWPETKLADWLKEHAPKAAVIGFDPWLHTVSEIEGLRAALDPAGIVLKESANLVDAIWPDQPEPPLGSITPHPVELAGESSADKRQRLAKALRTEGHDAAVLTLPDSIAWLLNIRGSDLPRVPVAQAFALLRADGSVDLFVDARKLSGPLDDGVRQHAPGEFPDALRRLEGAVLLDRQSVPFAVAQLVAEGGAKLVYGADPCRLPKACKTAAEMEGARAAHLRDGTAMVAFLCWLDSQSKGIETGDTVLTEIGVVRALEGFRRATNQLRDISFDTIAGTGPDGAIVHYRVTDKTDRQVKPGDLLLVDSGGQYVDGTTDITRTIAIGAAGEDERRCFTRVLKGMIAISRARWPKGLAGRDLDALARYPLWLAGQDYDHGTGHGVGSYLSIHEGPQRLSRTGDEPLRPGMILSNEPGYYREGAFGIRIENLLVVTEAPKLPHVDAREMLAFETLTYVPIDRRLIVAEMLDPAERAWLDDYHAETGRRLEPLLSPAERDWLIAATAPI
jgi:Xaa-Pro aminopeptidase